MSEKVKEVEVLSVWSVSLNCPHCEATQDGWMIDPRGKEHECDECGKTYRVPESVRVDF